VSPPRVSTPRHRARSTDPRPRPFDRSAPAPARPIRARARARSTDPNWADLPTLNVGRSSQFDRLRRPQFKLGRIADPQRRWIGPVRGEREV